MEPSSGTIHVPVLLHEVVDLLGLKLGQHVVDATLGGGGYTQTLLKAVGSSGRVLSLDWDTQAVDRFRQYCLEKPELAAALAQDRLSLANHPYSQIAAAVAKAQLQPVDAIVADLGLSSDQLTDPERGLSFQTDGPLDMRLNSRETVTAADIIAHWDETALAELFRVYGDEGEAGRIAQAIVSERRRQPITRTVQLAELIKAHVARGRRHGRIHPATQIFQALRIAVNSEYEELRTLLTEAWSLLVSGGRLALVSFHSGEDQLVKRTFQAWAEAGEGIILTKKPRVPEEDERTQNPRARSAKLRVIQKL